jgi:hypothetical protein
MPLVSLITFFTLAAAAKQYELLCQNKQLHGQLNFLYSGPDCKLINFHCLKNVTIEYALLYSIIICTSLK